MCNMKIKDHIRKMLFELGKIKVLPASIINHVKISENHDPMVDIKDDSNFFFHDNLRKESHVYLRKSVYNKLKATHLPEGYYFKIMSAYRPLDEQNKRWQSKCFELRQKYPNISEDELISKVRAFCADPRAGFGGHQTGGAVDITLCDKQGNNYDMGTPYPSMTALAHTDSHEITKEQAFNRQILVNTLNQLDFANYPLEWWHHSYGDRLWAAYKNKKECFYGMPSEEEFALTRNTEKNEIDITFSVPEQKGAYQGELVLNELRGSDSRDLAKIICDMAWNDTIKLLLKNDDEKAQYECFLQEKAPDLLGRWHEIMNYRQEIIQEAEQVLNKPFTEITPQEKSQLFEKIDNKSIPLDKWHINFSNLAPDTEKVYNTPEDAFLPAAQQYISGAYQRRQIEEGNLREGFWLAIRDKQSANLLGVVSISTKIIKDNLIGHIGRFISPRFQRQKIAGTAGSVVLDFMYKYLMDKEKPEIYNGINDPLFLSTCHPFNFASRSMQKHHGASFSQYNKNKIRFEYLTKRTEHEQTINETTPIEWKAKYKGMEITSKTGTEYPLSIQNKDDKAIFIQNIIDKNKIME